MKRTLAILLVLIALNGVLLVRSITAGYYYGYLEYFKPLQPVKKLPFGIVPAKVDYSFGNSEKDVTFKFLNYRASDSEYKDMFWGYDVPFDNYGGILRITKYAFNDSTLIFETIDSNRVIRSYVTTLDTLSYLNGDYKLNERKVDKDYADDAMQDMDVLVRIYDYSDAWINLIKYFCYANLFCLAVSLIIVLRKRKRVPSMLLVMILFNAGALIGYTVSGYYWGEPSSCNLLRPGKKLPYGLETSMSRIAQSKYGRFAFDNYHTLHSGHDEESRTESQIVKYGFNDSTLMFETIDSNMVLRTYEAKLGKAIYFDKDTPCYVFDERKMDERRLEDGEDESIWDDMDYIRKVYGDTGLDRQVIKPFSKLNLFFLISILLMDIVLRYEKKTRARIN